jgi:tetratricopeptide (TPR) repeat protein
MLTGEAARTAWEDWRPRDMALMPAFALWRAGRLLEAERAFRAHMDPPNEDACRGLGSVLWTRGCFDHALRCYSRAVRLGPWRAMNWSNLGLVLRDLGRLEQALSCFDVALSLDELYEPAWNERGNVLFDLGRADLALPHYRRALELDGGRAVVHHNHGMCLVALGDTLAARVAFETALKIDSSYSWSVDMLQRVLNKAAKARGCQSTRDRDPLSASGGALRVRLGS